jgi:hypothetical protein
MACIVSHCQFALGLLNTNDSPEECLRAPTAQRCTIHPASTSSTGTGSTIAPSVHQLAACHTSALLSRMRRASPCLPGVDCPDTGPAPATLTPSRTPSSTHQQHELGLRLVEPGGAAPLALVTPHHRVEDDREAAARRGARVVAHARSCARHLTSQVQQLCKARTTEIELRASANRGENMARWRPILKGCKLGANKRPSSLGSRQMAEAQHAELLRQRGQGQQIALRKRGWEIHSNSTWS